MRCEPPPTGRAPAGSHADRTDAGHNLALSQMAVAATFTTIAFDDSSLRWFEIST
jgi:hypothetical protein